jgi:hypothetical protein
MQRAAATGTYAAAFALLAAPVRAKVVRELE